MRQTQRQPQIIHRYRERWTERDSDRDRWTARDTDKSETERHRQTDSHTDRQTDRQTDNAKFVTSLGKIHKFFFTGIPK